MLQAVRIVAFVFFILYAFASLGASEEENLRPFIDGYAASGAIFLLATMLQSAI